MGGCGGCTHALAASSFIILAQSRRLRTGSGGRSCSQHYAKQSSSLHWSSSRAQRHDSWFYYCLSTTTFNGSRKSCLDRRASSSAKEEFFLHESQCCYGIFWLRRLRVVAAKDKSYADDTSRMDKGDILLKCISRTAEVSVLCISATKLVQEAQRRHNLAPTALAALGRALMGTLLLRALKDNAESIQITFSGDGPLGQMTTIAPNVGWAKGFVGNPLCDPTPKPNGKLDVGTAVGAGILSVVRSHPNWKHPYIGTIPIYSGEIAEDLAHHLINSEQVNTAIGLAVNFSKDGIVESAQGFLVQVLPFCSEETLSKLEENILRLQPFSDNSKNMAAQRILEFLLNEIGMGEIHTLARPRFGPCNIEELKPRMMHALASLGSIELQRLLHEKGFVEVRCEFCAEAFRFGKDDFQHILESSLI